jgi:quinoprotein dehydrogenase-associated probable ABC transporter substrate-binding protein
MRLETIGLGFALAALMLPAAGAASAATLQSLTVCADPGNMPLSDQQGEGFENKIAQVIGKALGTGVGYYWRPSTERGLMRTTLSEGNCDLWMDMATDTEGAEVLPPLYRSTFVLAYRSDKGIHIKNLDDPALKKLRIGVYQTSAIRQALAGHGIQSSVVVQYMSHNGDLVKENQPSYQVQQAADGGLDIAAAWGPMAGYYKTIKHEPLVLQPANLMEDTVPLEFDMALAVARGRPQVKEAIETAVRDHRDEIKQILVDYGVPLVKCDECTISGDLPSHGPYQPPKSEEPVHADAKVHAERMAAMKKSLAEGASPDVELQNAIVADDIGRARYLVAHGAHLGSTDGEGYTPLLNSARYGFMDLSAYFIGHEADTNQADRSGWTPLMYAAWRDDPELVRVLLAHGARLDTAEGEGLTAFAIAAQNGKAKAAGALMVAGADVNAPVAKGGYTPLMLASISGSSDLAGALIEHGAKVNAVNPGGVTALMIAAAGNRAGLASLLIKSGADVNARSQDGRTALAIARDNNSDAVIKLLQQASAQGGNTG